MVSSEDIGRAIEEASLRKELNRSPYDALQNDDILTDQQLNQRIMRPEWDSSKLHVMKPKITIEECYVQLQDQEGNPVYRNGKKVVVKKEVKVFDSWENKSIEVPGGNLFKSDLTTSISSPTDMALINKMIDTYLFTIQLSMATEEDYSYDLYKLYNLMGGSSVTTKARGGKTLEMLKTQITKGEQTSTIRQMLLQDQQRKGLFGSIRNKLPF